MDLINPPQISEAGEVKIGGCYGTSGLKIQLASAVTDHIALIGNESYEYY